MIRYGFHHLNLCGQAMDVISSFLQQGANVHPIATGEQAAELPDLVVGARGGWCGRGGTRGCIH